MVDTDVEVAPALRPSQAFDDACRAVVAHLARVAPMALWAITRIVDGRQTVLVASGEGYGPVDPGLNIAWEHSFCRPMITGRSPRVVEDVSVVAELDGPRTAAAAMSFPVGAYLGTPIVRADGDLFGTVCGVDPEPLGETASHLEPLLDLLSSLLSAVLAADLAATCSARALETAVGDAETDVLTGLLNRRGWERWLDREEARFRRFGDPASVVMMDLDLLKQVNDQHGHAEGDRYIRAAADTLRTTLRASDALARLGGDEFAMVVHAGAEDARHLVDRLQDALEVAGVPGSFGFAPFTVVSGFPGACAAADEAMYADKRARRAARVAAG